MMTKDELRDGMREAGLQHRDVAEAIGVTTALVSHWVTGRRKIRYCYEEALRRLLSLPPQNHIGMKAYPMKTTVEMDLGLFSEFIIDNAMIMRREHGDFYGEYLPVFIGTRAGSSEVIAVFETEICRYVAVGITGRPDGLDDRNWAKKIEVRLEKLLKDDAPDVYPVIVHSISW